MLIVRYIGKRFKEIYEAHAVFFMLLFGFLASFSVIVLGARVVFVMTGGEGIFDGFWWENIMAGIGMITIAGMVVFCLVSLFGVMKREVVLYKRYADKFRGRDSKSERGGK